MKPAPLRQIATPPEDAVLARRIFALNAARSYWSQRGRVASVTLDVSLAERIDAFLAGLWAAERRTAMAALGHAIRHVRNENSLVPAARFLAGAWAERKAAMAALAYAMRHGKDERNLVPAAQEALGFLLGRKTDPAARPGAASTANETATLALPEKSPS